MKNYEVMYILSPQVDDAAKEAVIEKFSAVVTSAGGTVEKVDKIGTKKLAYPIDFKKEGFYVLMTFSAPEAVPAEINRLMNISDEVIRHIIVKKGA